MRAYFSRQNLTIIIIMALLCLAFLTENSLFSIAYFGWMAIALIDRLQ
ncbi:TPA: hypothetical protein ACPEZA_001072 [Klebsiella michiganensis]